MKFIPSFGEFSIKGKAAFKRLPIVITWAIVGTIFTLVQIESETMDENIATNTIITFSLGVSWLIAARFFIEQFHKDKTWILVFPFLLIGVFYVSLPTTENLDNTHWTRFLLYLLGGHLAVFVAPFVLKWQKKAYFNYLKSIFIAIVRSAFFSLILYLGIILALAAFENLFNFDIDSKRYFQIFIICLGIVNTWIYLSDFPKNIYQQTTLNYTKALEVFVKYILIPLVILYLVILYAYGFKILINWNLPKGWVSYLVIALSFLGFIIQICVNPIQKTIDSRVIKRFYPWFYRLLLPLIVLLFVAIFRRILEYGVTEKRYFVLVLSLWILAMTFYMLFSKKKQIRTFPLTLGILSLVISVGFWSAFSVSTKSQVKQFSKIYLQMKEKSFKVSSDEKKQFNSILRYLGKKKQLKNITPVLGYNPTTAFNVDSYWEIQRKIADSLQIKVIKSDNDIESILGKSNYFYLQNENNFTINIKGYDFFKQLYINKSIKNNSIQNYYFYLDTGKNIINIKKGNVFYQIDLKEFIVNMIGSSENQAIYHDRMTLIKEFETLRVKLIFQNISFNRLSENQTYQKIQNARVYVLIKEK